MNESISDSEYKDLISAFQKGIVSKDGIAETLSSLIYNFPKVAFRASPEDCQDFFIYILERLEKILLKYKVREDKFNTWFTVTLRNHYLNWLKKQKRQGRFEQRAIEFNPELYEYQIEDTNEENFLVRSNINKHVNELPPKVRCIIKLRYWMELSGDDIREISSIFEIPILDVLAGLKELDEKLCKIENEYLLETEKAAKEFEKYRLLQNQKKYGEEFSNIDSQLDLQIKKAFGRFKNLQNSLDKKRPLLQIKEIAKLLNINRNAVDNLLHRGKGILKKKLE